MNAIDDEVGHLEAYETLLAERNNLTGVNFLIFMNDQREIRCRRGRTHLCYPLHFELPLVLVLEADIERWPEIYSLAKRLIQSLPGKIGELRFLGSRKIYPISGLVDFQDQCPSWFAEHRQRVSLLNPVL